MLAVLSAYVFLRFLTLLILSSDVTRLAYLAHIARQAESTHSFYHRNGFVLRLPRRLLPCPVLHVLACLLQAIRSEFGDGLALPGHDQSEALFDLIQIAPQPRAQLFDFN
jgi:hypothetical protein